jgi:hypothetical protein
MSRDFFDPLPNDRTFSIGFSTALPDQAGMRAFPAPLPEQPIFYPVLIEEYDELIFIDNGAFPDLSTGRYAGG